MEPRSSRAERGTLASEGMRRVSSGFRRSQWSYRLFLHVCDPRIATMRSVPDASPRTLAA